MRASPPNNLLPLSLLLLISLWSSCSSSIRSQNESDNLFETRLIRVGKGYSSTSVNTTIFRNNSLVTHENNQYIGYYDADGYLTLGKRNLDEEEWELHRTNYRGRVEDAHNGISLMVDGEGYLHVAFDHHNDTLHYCRSMTPGSLLLGSPEEMIGRHETEVTYPEFYRLPEGDLLFVYRSGASGAGNLIMNRYDLHTRNWHRVQEVLIDGEGARSAYWQLCVDEQGTIHLSWVWRETWEVETNHDLCYARSFDSGETWYRTDGTKYELPIRIDNAEYACRIPQASELINQTGMGADVNGNPYIATYWCSPESDIPQYRLVWHDGHEWHHAQISNRHTPFTLKGGGTKKIPIARPRIVVKNEEIFCFFRDEERDNRVSAAYTTNLQDGIWDVTDLTDFPVDAWEPSIDTELWKQQKSVHLFVQQTRQGDGEQKVETEAQPVYVLELSLPNIEMKSQLHSEQLHGCHN